MVEQKINWKKLIAVVLLVWTLAAISAWITYTPTAINPSPAAPGNMNDHYTRGNRRIARINGVTIALAPTTAGDYVYRSTNDSTWTQMGTLGSGVYKSVIITGKDSTFYVYYYSGTTLRQRKWVYTVTSVPAATTILTHATLGTTGTGAYRSMAAAPDSAGNIYVVWHMGTVDSMMVIRSDDDGNTWASPVKISSGASALFDPHIDFTNDDTCYVTFGNWLNTYVYYSKSGNHGATWTTGTVRNASTMANPSLLCIGDDSIFVAYQQNLTNQFGIYLSRSYNNGGTWQTAVRIDSSCQYGDPSMALGSDKTIYCVYRTDKNSGITGGTCGTRSKARIRQSTNGGTTWTTVDSAVVGLERVGTKTHLRYQTWHNYGGLLQWTWLQYTSSGAQKRTYYDMNRSVTIMQYGSTYEPPAPPAGEAPDSLWVRSDGTDSLRIVVGEKTGYVDSTIHYIKKGYGGVFTRLGKISTYPSTNDYLLSLASTDTLWHWYISWYDGFIGDTVQGLWGADLAKSCVATGATLHFHVTFADSGKRNIDSVAYAVKTGATPPTSMTDISGGSLTIVAFTRAAFADKAITVTSPGIYSVSVFTKRWRKGGDSQWYIGSGDSATVMPLSTGPFIATSIDTTGINVQASKFHGAPDSIRVQYAPTAYPPTRTTGTNFYAGHDTNAVNNDNFTGLDLTCNTIYYSRMFIRQNLVWITPDSADSDTLRGLACPATDTWDFQWTGEHVSGTQYGTNMDTSIAGTFTDGGAMSSTQSHSASNSFRLNGNDDVKWACFPGAAEGMIELWVYLDNLSQQNALFCIDDAVLDANNVIRAHVETTGHIYFRKEGNNVVTTLESTVDSLVATTWTQVCFRWSVANNIISYKIGANPWRNDTDGDAVTDASNVPDYIELGGSASQAIGGLGYIDDVTYYRSYDASWNGE